MILGATHAEIREVVQEVSERALTVLGIFLRIEDVIVPECVDFFGRHDRAFRVQGVETQEPLVPLLHGPRAVEGPSFAFVRVHEFDQDWFQIECLDFLEDRHGFCCQYGITLFHDAPRCKEQLCFQEILGSELSDHKNIPFSDLVNVPAAKSRDGCLTSVFRSYISLATSI